MTHQKLVRWSCVSCLILSVFWLFSSIVPALAQGTGAKVEGTITDASGGALPGAKLTLTNQDTGITRTVNSGGDGRYGFPDLPDGTYSLRVEQTGFATTEVHDIVVNIATTVERDVQMQVGTVQQQVTVEAQTSNVDTTKSQVAGLVSLQQITSLPLSSRQFLNLALLMPGTSQDASRVYYNNVQISAGGTFYSNGYSVDGVRNTWTEQGEPRQDFPEGAVSEFKVYTTQAPASMGLAMGGYVTAVTKSGTNSLHGDVYEYYREKALNAMTYFQKQAEIQDGIPKPPFRRSQYGADLGGPVVKNRTHFYTSFERTQTSDSFTVFTNPTDYSAVNGTFDKPSWRDLWLARIDQKINDKQTLFVRYAGERELQGELSAGGTGASTSGFNQHIPRESVVLGYTVMHSANLLNDFRFQYAFSEYIIQDIGFPFWTAFNQFPAQRIAEVYEVFNFPSLTWGAATQQLGPEKRAEWNDDVTFIRGNHEFHFGGELAYVPFKSGAPGNVQGTYTFGTDQVFNPNNPATIAALTNPILFTQSAAPTPQNANTVFNSSYFGGWVMDNWRATRRLNVTLGLRYDRQYGLFDENYNFSTYPVAAIYASLPYLPYVNVGDRGSKLNLGPRAGFSWDVTGSGKTVVRGGFGMYYNNVRTLSVNGERGNLRKPSITIVDPTYPNPYGPGQTFSSFLSTAPPNITILGNNFTNPYDEQFNLGTTRQLTNTMSISVDGSYVHSFRDYQTWDVNQEGATGTGTGQFSTAAGKYPGQTGVGPRPLSQWGIISQEQPTSKGKYGAMYVRFQKSMSHHYQFLFSYTLSDCKDNDPAAAIFNLSNPQDNWGYCTIDRRNTLISSGSYQLPYGFVVSAIWSLRSTLPFNTTAAFSNEDGTTQLVPGTVRDSGDRNLNLNTINAYRATLGDPPIPASQIQSTRFNEVDFRAAKDFFVKGERKLEIAAQVFNLFNTKNLYNPSSSSSTAVNVTGASSAEFGEILTANIGAQAELVANFTF